MVVVGVVAEIILWSGRCAKGDLALTVTSAALLADTFETDIKSISLMSVLSQQNPEP